MRLVDADCMIQKINELSLKPGMPKKIALEEACSMIIDLCVREAPTAYDVSEVVKNLRDPNNYTIVNGKHFTTVDRSVEIVKEGGIR